MIRGRNRPLPISSAMESQKNVAETTLMGLIHNRFDIEVVDATTGNIKQRIRAFNTVLDTWWAYPTTSIEYIAYGGGSGTPSRTDTALFSPIANISSITKKTDVSTYLQGYVSLSCSAQLGPSDAVGKTITEVGLCKYRVSGNYRYSVLVTHAMLQDMNGNPISITKTATDIINIYGTVFLHFGVTGYRNKTMLLCNVSFLTMFCGNSTYNSDQKIKLYGNAAIYSSSTGENSAEAVRLATTAWDEASKTYTITFGRAAVDSANIAGGIYVLHYVNHTGILGSSAASFMLIRPSGMSRISGEAVGTADGEATRFKTNFHFPQNATVYVDGVAKTSGVSVVPDCSQASNMNVYLLRLDENSKKDCIFGSTLSSSTRTISAYSIALFEYLFCEIVSLENLTFNASNVSLYASNDLENWVKIGTTGSTTSSRTLMIPSEYGKYKYWKVETLSSSTTLSGGQGNNLNGYAIRFDEAPASGAVITVDYDTPMIPKDENHVMDMTLSFVLGEYSDG